LHEYERAPVISDEEVERIEPVGAAAKAAALASVQQRELQETFTDQRGKQRLGFEIGVSQ
jgi:hypothetical protein